MGNFRAFFLVLSGFFATVVVGRAQQQRNGQNWETVTDSTAFNDTVSFNQHYNMFYPWGTDHNGTARMYREQVSVKNGVLKITAKRIKKDEGNSSLFPEEKINYHSGAVHAKHQITVTKEYPEYRVYGEFKAPVKQGTWPAFWLTAVKGWPPETDILEFKGDSLNWQNTFITPKQVTTIKQTVPDAMEKWHSYEVVLRRVNDTETTLTYFFDGKEQGTHNTNFTGHALWLIINLQMEGSAKGEGPKSKTRYMARNVIIQRIKSLN